MEIKSFYEECNCKECIHFDEKSKNCLMFTEYGIKVMINNDEECAYFENHIKLGNFEKKMKFDKFWEVIQTSLRNWTSIKNWTVLKGYLGDIFEAKSQGSYIMCDVPTAENIQEVPKEDFYFIYNKWEEYLDGIVKRKDMLHFSRYTKYIISIIHHFEEI